MTPDERAELAWPGLTKRAFADAIRAAVEEAVAPLQSVIARISTCHRCDSSQDSESLDEILGEQVCINAISARSKAEGGA